MDEILYDDFRRYFPHTPTALCIKECVRLAALRGVDCPGPILDVGCGDGLFARLAFQEAEVWGIDIDATEGRHAQASNAYSQIVLGDITRATLPEGFFRSCVANCSLEHVPDLDAALRTIYRSLAPGGQALMFVPNREWASHLLSARVLERAGLGFFARELQQGIDRVFKHHHLYDAKGWSDIVARAGFEIVAVDPIGSTASTVAFESFLLPSLVGLLTKRLAGRWSLVPDLRKTLSWPVFAAVRGVLAAAGDETPTAEFLVVARKPVKA